MSYGMDYSVTYYTSKNQRTKPKMERWSFAYGEEDLTVDVNHNMSKISLLDVKYTSEFCTFFPRRSGGPRHFKTNRDYWIMFGRCDKRYKMRTWKILTSERYKLVAFVPRDLYHLSYKDTLKCAWTVYLNVTDYSPKFVMHITSAVVNIFVTHFTLEAFPNESISIIYTDMSAILGILLFNNTV